MYHMCEAGRSSQYCMSGVYLDLDHSRLDASVGQQVLQLLHAEVADANRLGKEEHSHQRQHPCHGLLHQ